MTTSNPTNLIIGIDLETTGLIPGCNEIIEIAMVKLDSRFNATSDRYHGYLKILRPEFYTIEAQRVNNLTVEQINARGKDPNIILNEVKEWLDSINVMKQLPIPIGHNYKFDRDFLKSFFGYNQYNQSNYFEYFNKRYFDTLEVASQINKSKKIFSNLKLTTICEALGVENNKAHTAMSDILATIECHKRFLESYSGG